MTPTILLIEDEASARFGFVRYFTQEGYRVQQSLFPHLDEYLPAPPLTER